MTTTTNTTKAAFESWNNGGTQISGFHTAENAVEFEISHFKSGTFATIHTFNSIEEGEKAFAIFCDKIENEEKEKWGE
jgi:hypothetical protein